MYFPYLYSTPDSSQPRRILRGLKKKLRDMPREYCFFLIILSDPFVPPGVVRRSFASGAPTRCDFDRRGQLHCSPTPPLGSEGGAVRGGTLSNLRFFFVTLAPYLMAEGESS